MKKILIPILLLLPLMTQAQTVLTEEQQLEQAQKQLEAAKKALEIAKLKAEAARLKAQTDSINQAAEKATEKKTEKDETSKQKSEELKPTLVNEPTVSQGWAIPVATTHQKAETTKRPSMANGMELKEDPKYLEGAIPLNAEGKVEFVYDTEANGKSAAQIYNIVFQYMSELTQGDNNIASRVALVNKEEHVIANTMDEWIVFNSSFISLDRSEIKYHLVAKISDNHLNLTFNRIMYNYEEGRATGFKEPAENVITDKIALTKKKNDLAKIFGKFRRLTIDRKNQIFGEIGKLIKN